MDKTDEFAEVLFEPALSMEEEFRRDKRWTDWQGQEHSALEEWRYVVEEEARDRRPKGGSDAGHEGWRLARFVAAINAVVVGWGASHSRWTR